MFKKNICNIQIMRTTEHGYDEVRLSRKDWESVVLDGSTLRINRRVMMDNEWKDKLSVGKEYVIIVTLRSSIGEKHIAIKGVLASYNPFDYMRSIEKTSFVLEQLVFEESKHVEFS